MGPLGTLFSAIDTTKRKLGDLFSSPVQSAQQMVGYANDRARGLNELTSGAAEEMKQGLLSGGSTYGPKSQQLTQTIADAYNPMGMVVWHGSPHTFNKFDASKIGTGEGAQAYGHGLYLAESPDVAKSYQTALSADRGFSFGGKTGLTRAEVQDMVNAKYGTGYLDGVIRPSGVADSFIDDMVTGTGRSTGAYPRQYKPGSERAKIYDELRGQITHADPGSLYKVDLPDEAIAKMLDWDKPLSQQAPEVKKVFSTLAKGRMTGEQAWRAAIRESGNPFSDIAPKTGALFDTPEAASKNLQRLGITGIRYLDGGSRGTGAGTSNFVVFPGNENLLQILERNGQLLK